MRLRAAGLSLTLLVFAGAAPAVTDAQEMSADLSLIGKAAPAYVLAYSHNNNCVATKGQEDCVFVSPDGVEYAVFEGTICRISIKATKAVLGLRLPYGLKFGEDKTEAVAKLPVTKTGRGAWLNLDGRQSYTPGPGFFGDPDDLTGVNLWFDLAGRLREIEAQATCV